MFNDVYVNVGWLGWEPSGYIQDTLPRQGET